MVEDYVPDRLEFELASPSGEITKTQPAEVTVDGRYLYGAPASALELDGEVIISPAKERPGLAGYKFGLADEEVTSERQPLENLPETDAEGKARFTVSRRQAAGLDASARSEGRRCVWRSRAAAPSSAA